MSNTANIFTYHAVTKQWDNLQTLMKLEELRNWRVNYVSKNELQTTNIRGRNNGVEFNLIKTRNIDFIVNGIE